MSRNKQTVKSATDAADDSKFAQNIYTNSVYNGITLGDYSSNDSILQQYYSKYNSEAPNVQSAIETLAATSQIPINGIYTSSTSTNPNDLNSYQIDEISISFTGGSGDIATNSELLVHMYGVLFVIPIGSEVSNIKPLIETALTNSGFFQSVVVNTDDNITFPTITVTVSHISSNNKIPCFVEENGVNTQVFDNLQFEASISQTAGESTNLGYGTWTYLGFVNTTLSEGAINLHYFRRDA